MKRKTLAGLGLLCSMVVPGIVHGQGLVDGPVQPPLATGVPSSAEQPAGPRVSDDGTGLSGVSAGQLFDLADQAKVAKRTADAEAIYNALARDPNLEVRSEARFRLGMMLAEEKRNTDAALAFRAILDEQPDAVRVRLELARVLAAMGDEGRARQQLRQAQASGLPADVAQVVDRFASALRSNRRFGGNFEFAIAPDSNINRATAAKELDTVIAPLTLSEDAREQSGVGAHLTGQIYARLPLSTKLTLVPRLSGDGTFYRKSQFNDLSGSALLGLELNHGRSRIMPSVGVTWRTYGGKAYARTETADLRWTLRIGQRAQSDVGFSYGRTTYEINTLQNGNLFNLSVGIDRALSSRTGIGMRLTGTRQTAIDPGYSTASGGATLIGWRDMGRTTLFANATVRRLESDVRLQIFPDRRKEWFLRGSVGATFRQIEVAGFSPVVRIGYERNISTVGIYDYRRTTVDFGITRAF